jgi:hypothetical protein
MKSCWIVTELLAVHQCQFKEIIPAEMCCKEDTFEILLHVAFAITTESTDTIEYGETFMGGF